MMTSRECSLLILYNQEGKILLQHRTDDAPRFPGYWGFFGGKIENGESPEQGLARESLEELAYAVQNPKHLVTERFMDGNEEVVDHVFIQKYNNEPLQLGEGQGMGWFLPDETRTLKMPAHTVSIIERVKIHLRSRSTQS